MIELCSEYLSVRCIWLYVLIMSRTCFRVNLHSIVTWMSKNSFLERSETPCLNLFETCFCVSLLMNVILSSLSSVVYGPDTSVLFLQEIINGLSHIINKLPIIMFLEKVIKCIFLFYCCTHNIFESFGFSGRFLTVWSHSESIHQISPSPSTWHSLLRKSPRRRFDRFVIVCQTQHC